ncbi:MAG: hypothetical protein WBF68_08255 [Atribacterota bacterium]
MQYSKNWNKGVNILDIENIWSLPFNIPAAIAFYKTIKSIRIKVITHHHDFFWERFHYSSPTRQTIKDLLCTYFPPRGNQIKNTAINSNHVTLHLLFNKFDRINCKLRTEN